MLARFLPATLGYLHRDLPLQAVKLNSAYDGRNEEGGSEKQKGFCSHQLSGRTQHNGLSRALNVMKVTIIYACNF